MTNQDISNRIKKIRQDKGLNQAEFGKMILNAHKSLVSKWEKGQNLPNNERLKVIAELGNISVNELLHGTFNEYISNILIEEFGDKADLNKVKDIIEFYELTGDEFSYSPESLIRYYYALEDYSSNSNAINADSPKYSLGSFETPGLKERLNEDILSLNNEITIIEEYIKNKEKLSEDDFWKNRSIMDTIGRLSDHLEKVIEQVNIPTQDFYVYEGVIYFAVQADDITLNSIKFDSSSYDSVVIYNEYDHILETFDNINNSKLLNIIHKYKFTREDWYKIELSYLPTKWFVIDYETIKNLGELQVISNKVFSLPKDN